LINETGIKNLCINLTNAEDISLHWYYICLKLIMLNE
ncbi:MAG: hypothetical protein ACI9VT_000552, partial [Psychroserpens sp.]